MAPSDVDDSPVSSTPPDFLDEKEVTLDDSGDEPGHLARERSVAEQLPLGHEILFVAVVILAQFTTQAGLGQALALLNIIGDDFGITDPAELAWLVAGYSLTVGSFILISGRFGDMFGWKRMFVIGFAWFSLWSMIAGLAVYSNHVLFIFARVMQGIGPAITLPNGLALLGATYAPGPRKDMVFAIFGATAPSGAIVGNVFAGLFALAWWPWTFWSFSIALAFIAAVSVVVIPDPPKKTEVARMSLHQKLVALDLGGAFTGITALVLFNFAWNQAPIVGWSTPYVYICLIIGILFAAVFFYLELWVVSEPLIPFHAFSPDVSFVLGCMACGWASFGIWVYYLWVFLEQMRGLSPLQVTAQISPLAISGCVAALLTGFMLSRVRPAIIMTIALFFFLLGNILVGTAPVDQIYWAQIFVCTLVIPFGMDMSFPAATVMLSNSVEKKHQGIAASLVNTVVNYSISLGLGFAATVEVHTNHGGKTQADVLLGLRHAYYMSFGLAGLGLVLSLVYVAKGFLSDYKSKR
ncbi:uncharacterized protein HMPREF1541_00469 [Cyphellophora europaea CBS 101466]|uniref:Major facilitator superfamily (MFS) profile domain-containing protein n=1 Tax=Cyphellophora europaea (strain CBS 101466) TaxID=1220924 RepID=W2SCE2_CYPE1|nr:uncharacterized protein HMPREF1541_00469 [Cyphellophora europaea CBS 101466]ETN46285.1 hypothetical protein HMPREF1541_00469 [Cyphellophora europaea CBS 101466]